MREISTEDMKVGEHIIVDGVEYVAEEDDGDCNGCDLFDCRHCHLIPCELGLILKRVETDEEQEKDREQEDNDTPMTTLQLSEWLAKGNGQHRFRNLNSEYSFWIVDKDKEDLAVDDDILIHPWGTDEWIKPTVEIYRRDCR